MTDDERQEHADEQFAPAPYYEDDETGAQKAVAYTDDAEDNLSPAVRALMASCALPPSLSVFGADDSLRRISGKSKSRIEQEEEPDVRKVRSFASEGSSRCSFSSFRRFTSHPARTRSFRSSSLSYERHPSQARQAQNRQVSLHLLYPRPNPKHPHGLYASSLSALARTCASTTTCGRRAAGATMRWAISASSCRRAAKSAVRTCRPSTSLPSSTTFAIRLLCVHCAHTGRR